MPYQTNLNPEITPIGSLPPLGVVPKTMHAQTIREQRFGNPSNAFQSEIVPVPEIGPKEVLVAVMAAGVNYNNVWAAQGHPVNVIAHRARKGQTEDFHIGGSDAAGIVYRVGSEVNNVKLGDEVVIHCMQWDLDDPFIRAGGDPLLAPSSQVWGFEQNWGSFAQFCKVQERQCLPKPEHLSWVESASYLLCGMTVQRMVHRWQPNRIKPGDVVLVWGGAGGLGVVAIQLARLNNAIPIAVVSDDERGRQCMGIGAEGYINRKAFNHWGPLSRDINDKHVFNHWCREAKNFGRAIWEIAGRGNNPDLVIEHPGESTMPTSLFVCKPGGMVVTCAGTSGYAATLDLRFLWMRSKRLQGSHAGDDDEASHFNQLVAAKKVKPCVSRAYGFEETGRCHQLMSENRHPLGNMVILVGANTEIGESNISSLELNNQIGGSLLV